MPSGVLSSIVNIDQGTSYSKSNNVWQFKLNAYTFEYVVVYNLTIFCAKDTNNLSLSSCKGNKIEVVVVHNYSWR